MILEMKTDSIDMHELIMADLGPGNLYKLAAGKDFPMRFHVSRVILVTHGTVVNLQLTIRQLIKEELS